MVKISDLLAERAVNPDGLHAIVTEVVTKDGKNGQYLTGKLSDNTGSIKFNVWDGGGSTAGIMKQGAPVVICAGTLDSYQGVAQVNIKVANAVSRGVAEAAGIIPASPCSQEQLDTMLGQVIELIEKTGMQNGLSCIRDVLNEMGEDGVLKVWKTMPAALKVHQAYVRGLLEHSLSVARIAHRTLTVYRDMPGYIGCDEALLLTGALFHDIGKVWEYELSPLGLVDSFTLNGGMTGHLFGGATYINKLYSGKVSQDIILRLQHIILSHHGKKEWGSPVEPAFFEALVIHSADMVDSQFGYYTTNVPGSGMWVQNFGRAPILNPSPFVLL